MFTDRAQILANIGGRWIVAEFVFVMKIYSIFTNLNCSMIISKQIC